MNEQDHEPVEIVGYKVTNSKVMLEVVMESPSGIWENYNKSVDICLVWADCEDDEEENLVLVYAKLLKVNHEKRELFDKVAKLAKMEPGTLFPEYKTLYCAKLVDNKCQVDHVAKFDATQYEEEYSFYHFANGRKWATAVCWSCNISIGIHEKQSREILAARVCHHYFLDKGECTKPFLCGKCYSEKLGSSGRTSRRKK